jgi:hypothetical protein
VCVPQMEVVEAAALVKEVEEVEGEVDTGGEGAPFDALDAPAQKKLASQPPGTCSGHWQGAQC